MAITLAEREKAYRERGIIMSETGIHQLCRRIRSHFELATGQTVTGSDEEFARTLYAMAMMPGCEIYDEEVADKLPETIITALELFNLADMGDITIDYVLGNIVRICQIRHGFEPIVDEFVTVH